MTTEEKETTVDKYFEKILTFIEPMSKELYERMLRSEITEKQLHAIKTSIITKLKEEF